MATAVAARDLPAILGIAWFWFTGASLLAVSSFSKGLPGRQRSPRNLLSGHLLHRHWRGIVDLRAPFAKGQVELGLVPIGSIGITIFLLDLFISRRAVLADPLPFRPSCPSGAA